MNLEKAKAEDLEFIKNLLKSEFLPFEDIIEASIEMFVIYKNSEIIGCFGIETYNQIVLLRSFVLQKDFRSCGLGIKAFQLIKHLLKERNIVTVYLLTTTAEKFFSKLGFQTVHRSSVPEDIKSTTEFQKLCPKTAVTMKLTL